MRADKKKNKDKVAASLIKNPLQTEKEISEDTGLGMGTVHRAKKEVEKTGKKDDRIISLTDADFEILKLTQKHTKERLEDKDKAKKINARDMTYIGDIAAKRYQIFRGEITDKHGGLKNSVKDKSTEELLKIIEE